MITYRIISNSGRDKTELNSLNGVTPKDPKFKEIVFRRALAKCNFQEDQWVKIRGTSRRALIKEIYTDTAKVTWQRDRPFFIEVELEDGNRMLAAPYQLHRKKMR